MDSLPLLQFSYAFPRFELLCHELDFCFQSNEGGRAVTSMVVCESCSFFMEQMF
jgi:hypothetical protein